jgi:hypothetical protein
MIRYERDANGEVVARTQVAVGAVKRELTALLGPWPEDDLDPGGLRGSPVVVLRDATWTELARHGALRAGGQPTVLLLPAEAPRLGIQLLVAYREGVDVVVLEGGNGEAMTLVRILAGRPIPALPLGSLGAVEAMLAGCEVDVDVPIPTLDERPRSDLRARLAPLRLEDVHHLVEVDPRPAFDALGFPIADAPPAAMSAAAAGVLAGRVSVRSRRWRPPLT